MCFLAELFKTNNVYKIKSEFREFKSKTTSSSTECRVVSSNYHMEVTPSESESQDRLVVQQLLKELGATQSILGCATGEGGEMGKLKVLVLNEADRLSKEAQAGLRRTMEKYAKQCRLILVCENVSRVMQPLRSRCLLVRVPAPSPLQIEAVLLRLALKEPLLQAQPDLRTLLRTISLSSEHNLRRAIIALQEHKLRSMSSP